MNTIEYRISPVLQFSLLLVPIVLSSFLFVYAVVGLVLERRDKIQWSLEAWEVTLMTAAVVIPFSALVLLLVKVKHLGLKHILEISSYFHVVLSVSLVILVATPI